MRGVTGGMDVIGATVDLHDAIAHPVAVPARLLHDPAITHLARTIVVSVTMTAAIVTEAVIAVGAQMIQHAIER